MIISTVIIIDVIDYQITYEENGFNKSLAEYLFI